MYNDEKKARDLVAFRIHAYPSRRDASDKSRVVS
jgi:hypothetical protein